MDNDPVRKIPINVDAVKSIMENHYGVFFDGLPIIGLEAYVLKLSDEYVVAFLNEDLNGQKILSLMHFDDISQLIDSARPKVELDAAVSITSTKQ